ncbi:unnamed protein product [Urochloa humidicola]
MDSRNIESGNVDDLEARPLKKVKIEQTSDCELSSSPRSPTSLACDAETVACSELSDFESDNDKKIISDDNKHEDQEQFEVDQTYDYLPQDYTMTDLDYCAQITIESSMKSDILVKIDDFSVTQAQLSCLLDPGKFLNDDVISAYICCMKDQAHLQSRNGVKFYFEHPLISAVLKRDGNLGVCADGNYITKIVRKYLKHEMVTSISMIDMFYY